MTILMTFFGSIVFVFSCFTVGFKSAMKRLGLFALTGFIIDLSIIVIAVVVSLALTLP